MYVYFIIGIIIITFTSYRMAVKDAKTFRSNLLKPTWWIATIACVVFWPVLVLWAIIDIVLIINMGKES